MCDAVCEILVVYDYKDCSDSGKVAVWSAGMFMKTGRSWDMIDESYTSFSAARVDMGSDSSAQDGFKLGVRLSTVQLGSKLDYCELQQAGACTIVLAWYQL